MRLESARQAATLAFNPPPSRSPSAKPTNSPAGSAPKSSPSAISTAPPSRLARRSPWRPCRSMCIGIARRHARLDPRPSPLHRHARARQPRAHGRLWRHVRGQGLVFGRDLERVPIEHARSLARALRRHHLRPRLSLSGRRMDLSPHRRQTLRARLPARPPDGQGNPAVHGALRRRARSGRQRTKAGIWRAPLPPLSFCAASIRKFSRK